ncbi:MAG: response regulator [Gemmatimonadales bacterium]
MMARILLVEDDALVRKSVHRALERAGHEVWESAGPKTALHMLDCVDVDVVITDIYMPGMNGVELIRRLESREHCRRVIAMTGGGVTRTSTELLAEAMAVGADFTIEKPFGPEKLLSAVQEVLRQDVGVLPVMETEKEMHSA